MRALTSSESSTTLASRVTEERPVPVRSPAMSRADSKVDSVVALMASMLFKLVVSPPEKMLVLPMIKSPPAMVRSPVR